MNASTPDPVPEPARSAEPCADCGPACADGDLALACAQGRLDEDARGAFLRHAAACDACARLWHDARAAFAALDLALASPAALAEALGVAPAAQSSVGGEPLWQRIRERTVERPRAAPSSAGTNPPAQRWRTWTAAPAAADVSEGFSVVEGSAAFEPTGFPGIDVKRLAVDPARRAVTMLVRMAPGTSYPPHRHADREECFVLQGDLWVGDRELHPGDFQLATAGSRHATQSTRAGCLLLITSSQDDELL